MTSQNGGPYAVKTFAGWTIIGPLHVSSDGPATVNCNRIVAKEIRSDVAVDHYFAVDQVVKEILTPEALNRMMEIDFSERKVENERSLSQEDKLFLKKVKQGTKKVEGHYEIPLPFREDDVIMPDNRAQVEQKAYWIKKKLLKDNLLRKQYTEFMNDMLVKGYARKVPLNATGPKKGKVWYLPHRAVYHPKKPDKVRVVFDCSARFEGAALNDRLLQGPDLTNLLIGVLVRFREEPVAFMGDIEAMFYQVRILKDQRNFVPFLWWPDGDLSQDLAEYEMTVHIFGAVSSPSCSNFGLRRAADDYECKIGTESADVLRKNFYVDDCLRSDKTVHVAINRMHNVIDACVHAWRFSLNKTYIKRPKSIGNHPY